MKNPSIKIAVSKDKSYYYCSCGLSKSQPFCNDSHRNNEQGRRPVHYVSLQDKSLSFFNCKKTNHPAICYGSYKKLINNL